MREIHVERETLVGTYRPPRVVTSINTHKVSSVLTSTGDNTCHKYRYRMPDKALNELNMLEIKAG